MKAMLLKTMAVLLATFPLWHSDPAPMTSRAPTAPNVPKPTDIPFRLFWPIEAKGYTSMANEALAMWDLATHHPSFARMHLGEASLTGYRHWLHGNAEDCEPPLYARPYHPLQMEQERIAEEPAYHERVLAHLRASLTLVPGETGTAQHNEERSCMPSNEAPLDTADLAEPKAVEPDQQLNSTEDQEQ
jgi:hypothetical protein